MRTHPSRSRARRQPAQPGRPACAGIAALLALALVAMPTVASAAAEAEAQALTPPPMHDATPTPGALPGSFADLSDRLSPAVVNISTSQTVDGFPGLGEGSPLEDLFRHLYPEGGETPHRVQSLGSGFVIDAAGVIVTNNHVIQDADEITVTFPDGLTLEAEVTGVDQQTDIAVLKVEHDKPLPFVAFGDSDTARVGDWVLAIGNPFGFAGSVSAGIISARNRNINAGRYDDFIQTDAAINRGNSGGPLFNMAGEVIGVNTAIVSPTGGSIGIGFAVPSVLVEQVVGELREFGEARRGWLGVRIQTVNDEMAEALGLDSPRGALVADVSPDSPAAKAGIEVGDVIVEFNGQEVAEMRALPRIVADTAIDETVPVTVIRKGETVTVTATIALLDEDGGAAMTATAPGAAPEPVELAGLGLTVTTLSAQAREAFAIPDGVEGVLVTGIAVNGEAAGRGIATGDVIVEVGQEPVQTPADIEARVAAAVEAGRSSVLFLIHSQGELRFVPLAVGQD